ncbi:MAG: thioredoxin domain-containing protein [Pseudanabaenaceae cyanobacterium SKYGB_i_bin29]|nr:thioredoxin domain-containing protein [Pseudanabaenaceae cyanobacterium SKYG29]MDW8421916.1 thioredoxin domain-containing protein [Pseudanabaenaceae cyanobacterium SKYGB_i_bin29]
MVQAQKFTNLVLAITTIVLATLLFLGIQTKNQDVSLPAVVRHSTPWAEAQQNQLPTVVEFYADWCTTCQSMAGDTRALQQEFSGQVNFVMLDVDNNRWLPEIRRFQVDGIPHFVFLDRTKAVVGEAIGFVPKEVMVANITALLRGEKLPHAKLISEQRTFFSSPLAPDPTQPRSHS